MINLIVEAALRSLALAALVWLAVKALRIRNPHIEKAIWTTVLLGALAMPALMQYRLSPQIPLASNALAGISIPGAMTPTPGRWLNVVALIYTIVASALLLRLAVAFCVSGKFGATLRGCMRVGLTARTSGSPRIFPVQRPSDQRFFYH